jgi:hypothetical protein
VAGRGGKRRETYGVEHAEHDGPLSLAAGVVGNPRHNKWNIGVASAREAAASEAASAKPTLRDANRVNAEKNRPENEETS